MQHSRRIHCWSLAAGLVLGGCALAAAAQGDEGRRQGTPAAVGEKAAAGEEFFEARIRPILVEHCQGCHGAEVQEASLRLDSREMLVAPASGEPVVVPGQADASRLIEVVRYEGDVQMPPGGKLSDEQVAALAAWVATGAAWPAHASGDMPPSMEERMAVARGEHWAFQPVVVPEPPAVQEASWCANPVDRFVLSKLEGRGLAPSAAADRWTLLRRASFDLIGLPPTAREVEAFLADEAPGAFGRAVERLLASPHYGERWGRHWLDVARYADTKGYVFMQERRYPFSYTYRDYVIRAFNEDLPYDRFLIEQLAADQLELGEENEALAAMGFLTLGRRFMLNTQDIIDDRIDVVTRGLMGLTVSCARCHDHKFDPIPTEDYYSLYGVFASSEEPDEEPLIGQPVESESYEKYQRELAEREKAYADLLDEKHRELERELRTSAGEYLVQVASHSVAGGEVERAMLSLGPKELRPQLVRRWERFIAEAAGEQAAVFGPWHAFAALEAGDFAAQATALAAALPQRAEQGGVNRLVAEALAAQPPASMVDVARRYGELLARVESMWIEAQAGAAGGTGAGSAGAVAQLSDPAAEQIRSVLYGESSPAVLRPRSARRLFSRDVKDQLTALERKVEELKVDSPAAPPRAMVLVDAADPVEPRVFIRGNSDRPGEEVPRRFLEVLSPPQREAFEQGSGRLEMARAIASPENPLTARVLVNRVWMHHFGAPLVDTPSDFGLRTAPPEHRELLDYLAGTFVRDGWSIKQLHRRIMLSSTYQQASRERPEAAGIDPENRLLWKMNRKRLEFEPIRDAYLAVAGRLDRALGGRPVDMWEGEQSARRTVYGFIDRQELPGILRNFDFANPDVSNEQRPRTTVPQQALFAMNSPFVLAQVRALAARSEVTGGPDPENRVQALYRLALSRPARPGEVALALAFLEQQAGGPGGGEGGSKMSPWELLAQVVLSTNEFVFID